MLDAALLPAAAPGPSVPGLHIVADPPAPAPDAPTAVPRLEIPPYEFAVARALERELGVSHAFAQVLVRRGLTDARTAREFLEPVESHDPGEFVGIERTVELIERHIVRGGRIIVHGDYDVDGVCATATLVRALRDRGADVGWFLPSRIDDGYGLALETVRRLAARGTDLLITVDCAITAVSEVGAARAGGLDVVVTDHHAPRTDGALPDCPIVHPAVCGYPCRDLCGTGVAYKLAQALGAATAAEDVELVALATVADLMPLRGENRHLVRTGLRALANTAKPGLRALMAVSRTDPSGLDAGALGFRLAPRINAAGRLRRADAGLELLLTEDAARATEVAAELDAVNVERRAVERRIVWEAEEQIVELGERSAFVLAREGWHPGVIGIVASRVVERHHRPAILVALEGEIGTGSGRSIPGFDLLGALHAGADHLERYGGHRAAAGLTLRRSELDAFRGAIERHADAVLTPELLEPVERVDAVVSGAQLGLDLAEELARLEPCGIGNPTSTVLVPGARFEDVRTMGEGRHARFSVASGGARARAVAFGCEGRLAVEPGEPADATFRLERNVWNGAVEPRLVLRHARRCSPRPIDVLGEPEDFLRSVLEELDAPLEPPAPAEVLGRLEPPAPAEALGRLEPPAPAATPRREVLDRRGESPLAMLHDALAAGGPVLAVCADVPRRLDGLSSRIGGFTLACYHALHRHSESLERFPHLVALDPPARRCDGALLERGAGYTHWVWGEAELRFAQQMHELEYGLRASLAPLYRALRARWRVTGQELERLLRGDSQPERPARLAGRLMRVLTELELVSLDRDLRALAIAGTAPTTLERSPSYRIYTQRLEDGRRYLSSANHLRPSG
jgi:single-stranded-DNA-specific exonuclease